MQRVLVDDGAAAGVDEDRGRLHHRQLALADQIVRRVVERHVQGHDVRGAQQLVEEREADAERVLLVLGEPRDVVVLDARVERGARRATFLPMLPRPDDAERLARQLVHAALVLVARPPFSGHHVVVEADQPLEHGEHEHDRVLGDGDGVGAAVVGDGHLGLARGLDVHAVVARAEELDEPQLRRGPEELAAHLPGQAEVVLGVGRRLVERGRAGIDDDQLEAGRRQRARDVEDRVGLFGTEEDLGGHASLLC